MEKTIECPKCGSENTTRNNQIMGGWACNDCGHGWLRIYTRYPPPLKRNEDEEMEAE